MKKFFVIVATVVLAVSLVATTAVQAGAQESDFLVGYARVDVNPYVVDGDINSGIMELPLRGSGDVWNRLSTKGLVDDNGDGKIDEEDGLAATCIAVSDSAGKTVLLITIDLIGGGLISQVRQEICSRVEAALASGELTNVDLAEDQIYYAGTHTHNAPDTTVFSASGKTGTNNDGVSLSTVNENLGIWIDRTIEDIGDAAILALKDRAAAKLTKDQLSASRDTQSPVRGKVMNTVRHYYNESGGCVAGDNFNTRGSNPKQVTQVNDVMYLVKFDFSNHNNKTGDDKLPIILANWRGHPSLNNSDDYTGGSRNCMSSDYVNAFRHALEFNCAVANDCSGVYAKEQTCRVAFFNGEGGNVNPRGREVVNGKIVGKWIDDAAALNNESRGTVYGRVLCAMAQHALASSSNRETVAPGEIRTAQYVYNSPRRTTGITALGYEAAKAYQATVNVTNPFRYKNTAGETYVVGSKFHASNLVSSWDTTYQRAKDDLVDMELNAFLIGEDLAFVTAPGEPFDYYYNADGSNAWKNLISSTYGTPFVLGYCNGAKGYIPNSEAYDYNLGSTKWMRGSYESNITPYEKGTGEHMIAQFGDMLQMLMTDKSYSYDAYCQHCQTQVTWDAYIGQSKLYTGHYYLRSDVFTPQIHIMENEQVCFDMNGHTLKGETRAFYTYVNGKSTLNLMDTSAEQTGAIMGCGGTNGIISGYGGATVLLDTGNTMNLYSGTVSAYQEELSSVYSGGVVRNKGVFNMYGGVITGGVGYNFTGSYLKSKVPTAYSRSGYGAVMYSSGVFNMYAGRVDAGVFKQITGKVTSDGKGGYTYSQTLKDTTGYGVSIYADGKVNISGDVQIADIFYDESSADLLYIDTSEKPFTGKISLTYGAPIGNDMVVGTCTAGTQLPAGAVTITNSGVTFALSGTQLRGKSAAVILSQSGGFAYYSTIDEALRNYKYSESNPSFIRLLSDTSDKISVGKKIYMDLNGATVNGAVNVADSAVLYCMDTKTDDYTVADGDYGRLSGKRSGNIQGVPAKTVSAAQDGFRDAYLAVTDKSGMSFHRIKLRVAKLSLRPDVVGMYYTGEFAGDEVVAEQIVSYGVSLNAEIEPDAEDSGWVNAPVDGWTSNTNATSLLLTGVMKPDNSEDDNAERAQMPVHGRAFVQTEQGYFYSDTVTYSLQQMAEIADETAVIKDEGLTKMAAMYALYEPIMENWLLPRLRLDIAAMH